MKSVGHFNLDEYLTKLNEAAEESGGVTGDNKEGLIIPAENKKTYDWLQKEYRQGKTEVKVEMKLGGSKFEPGYDFTAGGETIKDFKPGMYGDVKTSDTEGSKKTNKAKADESSEDAATVGDKKEPKKKGAQIKGATAGIATKKEEKKDDDD